MTVPSNTRSNTTSIDRTLLAEATAALREANERFNARYPGDRADRQPVHTVYGGAHLFSADTTHKLGVLAVRALGDYAATPRLLGQALGISAHPALETIHGRLRAKLEREPVEDYRVDFEDGYGNRPDAEEDHHAVRAASEIARAAAAGSLPRVIGIRVKALTEELRERSVRTLDLVLTALIADGGLPERWMITLPKVTTVEQVELFVAVLRQLERSLSLRDGTLQFEIMIEAPQVILSGDGHSLLPSLREAADGRLSGAHFGPYDYTSALNITSAQQRLGHPACDFARHMMQVGFAGTGVWLADGPTTVLPVPLHKPESDGGPLNREQRAENMASVHSAWRLHFDDVRRSLANGIYQGWDLHPAQLVSRYAAVYSFFLDGVDAAGTRLNNFVSRAAQATRIGAVFDDAATGQGLLNFFLRGIASGAITEDEALAMTSLTADELRSRSFAAILRRRT